MNEIPAPITRGTVRSKTIKTVDKMTPSTKMTNRVKYKRKYIFLFQPLYCFSSSTTSFFTPRTVKTGGKYASSGTKFELIKSKLAIVTRPIFDQKLFEMAYLLCGRPHINDQSIKQVLSHSQIKTLVATFKYRLGHLFLNFRLQIGQL